MNELKHTRKSNAPPLVRGKPRASVISNKENKMTGGEQMLYPEISGMLGGRGDPANQSSITKIVIKSSVGPGAFSAINIEMFFNNKQKSTGQQMDFRTHEKTKTFRVYCTDYGCLQEKNVCS